MIKHAPAAFAAFTLLAPSAAWADQADTTNADKDVIVVNGVIDQLRLNIATESASRLGLTPLETPASVETLDGDAIRLRGDLTIQDAAARATGIVNTSGVFGYGLSARGFTGQNSVMTLYDGMRMYNNTLTFPADPWMAQSVEILRGPASVLYGEGAIGGAVNVVRRQPGDTLEFAGRAGVASFGTVNIAAGAGGPVSDLVGFRADASYRRSDGWMDRGDSSAIALSGAIQLRPASDLSITFSHDFSTQKPRTWFGVPLVGGKLDKAIRRNNYNATDAKLRFRDNWSQAKVEWTPSDAVTIRSTFYHLWANKYWRNVESVTYVAATGTTPAQVRQSSFLELYHIQKQTGNRTTANLKQTFGGIENQLVLGFDVNRISYKNISNVGNNATRLVALGRLPHLAPFSRMTGADSAAVEEAMQRADVTHLRHRNAVELSGGERARAMLARALAVGAQGLVVDEPLASLDPGHQIDVMELLAREAHSGALVVAVLHDLTMAARYCDRLLLVDNGRLVADGPPAAVLTPARLAATYGISVFMGEDKAAPLVVPLGRTEASRQTPD